MIIQKESEARLEYLLRVMKKFAEAGLDETVEYDDAECDFYALIDDFEAAIDEVLYPVMPDKKSLTVTLDDLTRIFNEWHDGADSEDFVDVSENTDIDYGEEAALGMFEYAEMYNIGTISGFDSHDDFTNRTFDVVFDTFYAVDKECCDTAMSLMGDDKAKVVVWMNTPIKGLDGFTPFGSITTGGRMDVVSLLERMRRDASHETN